MRCLSVRLAPLVFSGSNGLRGPQGLGVFETASGDPFLECGQYIDIFAWPLMDDTLGS